MLHIVLHFICTVLQVFIHIEFLGLRQDNLRIHVHPSKAVPGGTVDLTCSWERNDDDKIVTFFKKSPMQDVETILVYGEGISSNYDPNMEKRDSNYSYELGITFLRVAEHDVGMYYCNLTILLDKSNFNYTSDNVPLDVRCTYSYELLI